MLYPHRCQRNSALLRQATMQNCDLSRPDEDSAAMYLSANLALGVFAPLCSPIEEAMKLNFHRCAAFRSIIAPLLLCLVPVLVSAQQSEEQPTIRFVRNPDPAPDFKLTGLDGKPVTLADSHGKVILLNFWATWCGPCRAEIPDLIELQNKYKDRLQILGLVVDDDDRDVIKEFVEKFGINYPVAIASDDIRFQYGGIAALPTSFVLDAEGRIVQKHEGLRDPILYETEIRSLLGLSISNVKVETFEDTGQIFLKNAERASELPGVDLSKLSPEQKTVALHKFNAETCTCGCTYTLAQCRIYDRNCQTSKAATSKIITALLQPAAPKSAPAAPVAKQVPDAASPSPEKPHD
jgi:thiol-disulfide isomerase/thioredoxin